MLSFGMPTARARQGKVDEGTSLLDSDPEEQKRRISINIALAAVPHEKTKINIVDTPGYADFQGDVKAALRVVDGAVVVVEGAAGLQVGTQTGWEYGEEHGLAGTVNVLHRTYRAKGKAKPEPVPADAKELLEEYRTALVEDVAET